VVHYLTEAGRPQLQADRSTKDGESKGKELSAGKFSSSQSEEETEEEEIAFDTAEEKKSMKNCFFFKLKI
jgi:hypothetical protein